MTWSKILAKASIKVMKAAEDHWLEMSEKNKAIEARRSTDTLRSRSALTALTPTGMSPRNERMANTNSAHLACRKKDATKNVAVSMINKISKIKNTFSSKAANRFMGVL